jgi:phosphoglycolate phosphatase-like HAD superfamily hydrolase
VATPTILALDFDGVICDGMREYFKSAWHAYRRLRPSASPEPPAGLFEIFARLRPVVETGWEMPTLLHAVLRGAAEAEILAGWRPDQWLGDLGSPREVVAAALDGARDEWIAGDEAGWLAAHRFYPGVIEQLRSQAGGPVRVYVITTKGERFARKLLEGQGVALPPSHVYGKEARRPKRAILRELAAGDEDAGVWFVEDAPGREGGAGPRPRAALPRGLGLQHAGGAGRRGRRRPDRAAPPRAVRRGLPELADVAALTERVESVGDDGAVVSPDQLQHLLS